MSKTVVIIERAVVTAIEAGAAYFALNGYDFTNKTVRAGAVGAVLSAVYNLLRESSPTLPEPTPAPSAQVIQPTNKGVPNAPIA